MTRLLLAAAVFAARALAAEQGQLDGSLSLFSVMAALNVAGFDLDADSPTNHPLRAAVRRHLAARNLVTLPELRQFLASHRPSDKTAELSQYISFALSVDGPPNFEYRFKEHELPPDVVRLAGFERLMTRFHREAGIDELWKQAQPHLEKVLESYQEPIVRALNEVQAYLRNTSGGYLGHRFQIYVELLAPPNQIHTRSYRNDYFVVLTPSPDLHIDEVRMGYLQWLLDPIALKFSEDVMKKKALLDYAEAAPLLPDFYKQDFLLLTTRSLAKAIESRMLRRPALIGQALAEGYILAPAFNELLAVYEKQEQAMRLYFPEMVASIDLKKEERRLDKVEFATTPVPRKVRPVERRVEISPAQRALETAEQVYAARDLERAKEEFRTVLKLTEDKPLHAQAYFGLARVATLQREPELAIKLFQKALELNPDAHTKAWSLVYLGRLADVGGDRKEAEQYYKDALAVEGASSKALEAAENGLKESFQGKKK